MKIKNISFKKLQKEWKEEAEREKNSLPYRMYKRLYRFIYNGFYLEDLYRDIRAFIQRGKRGWSNRDVWGLGDYISDVLVGALNHLKRYHSGYPGDLTEGQWIDILNELIWTFETAQEIWSGDVWYMGTYEWKEDQYQNMLALSKNKKTALRILSKKEAKKLEAGFKLFQIYFFSLWD
jgi:hypothetical protein